MTVFAFTLTTIAPAGMAQKGPAPFDPQRGQAPFGQLRGLSLVESPEERAGLEEALRKAGAGPEAAVSSPAPETTLAEAIAFLLTDPDRLPEASNFLQEPPFEEDRVRERLMRLYADPAALRAYLRERFPHFGSLKGPRGGDKPFREAADRIRNMIPSWVRGEFLPEAEKRGTFRERIAYELAHLKRAPPGVAEALAEGLAGGEFLPYLEGSDDGSSGDPERVREARRHQARFFAEPEAADRLLAEFGFAAEIGSAPYETLAARIRSAVRETLLSRRIPPPEEAARYVRETRERLEAKVAEAVRRAWAEGLRPGIPDAAWENFEADLAVARRLAEGFAETGRRWVEELLQEPDRLGLGDRLRREPFFRALARGRFERALDRITGMRQEILEAAGTSAGDAARDRLEARFFDLVQQISYGSSFGLERMRELRLRQRASAWTARFSRELLAALAEGAAAGRSIDEILDGIERGFAGAAGPRAVEGQADPAEAFGRLRASLGALAGRTFQARQLLERIQPAVGAAFFPGLDLPPPEPAALGPALLQQQPAARRPSSARPVSGPESETPPSGWLRWAPLIQKLVFGAVFAGAILATPGLLDAPADFPDDGNALGQAGGDLIAPDVVVELPSPEEAAPARAALPDLETLTLPEELLADGEPERPAQVLRADPTSLAEVTSLPELDVPPPETGSPAAGLAAAVRQGPQDLDLAEQVVPEQWPGTRYRRGREIMNEYLKMLAPGLPEERLPRLAFEGDADVGATVVREGEGGPIVQANVLLAPRHGPMLVRVGSERWRVPLGGAVRLRLDGEADTVEVEPEQGDVQWLPYTLEDGKALERYLRQVGDADGRIEDYTLETEGPLALGGAERRQEGGRSPADLDLVIVPLAPGGLKLSDGEAVRTVPAWEPLKLAVSGRPRAAELDADQEFASVVPVPPAAAPEPAGKANPPAAAPEAAGKANPPAAGQPAKTAPPGLLSASQPGPQFPVVEEPNPNWNAPPGYELVGSPKALNEWLDRNIRGKKRYPPTVQGEGQFGVRKNQAGRGVALRIVPQRETILHGGTERVSGVYWLLLPGRETTIEVAPDPTDGYNTSRMDRISGPGLVPLDGLYRSASDFLKEAGDADGRLEDGTEVKLLSGGAARDRDLFRVGRVETDSGEVRLYVISTRGIELTKNGVPHRLAASRVLRIAVDPETGRSRIDPAQTVDDYTPVLPVQAPGAGASPAEISAWLGRLARRVGAFAPEMKGEGTVAAEAVLLPDGEGAGGEVRIRLTPSGRARLRAPTGVWRLEPGQEVRLTLRGDPAIRAGSAFAPESFELSPAEGSRYFRRFLGVEGLQRALRTNAFGPDRDGKLDDGSALEFNGRWLYAAVVGGAGAQAFPKRVEVFADDEPITVVYRGERAAVPPGEAIPLVTGERTAQDGAGRSGIDPDFLQEKFPVRNPADSAGTPPDEAPADLPADPARRVVSVAGRSKAGVADLRDLEAGMIALQNAAHEPGKSVRARDLEAMRKAAAAGTGAVSSRQLQSAEFKVLRDEGFDVRSGVGDAFRWRLQEPGIHAADPPPGSDQAVSGLFGAYLRELAARSGLTGDWLRQDLLRFKSNEPTNMTAWDLDILEADHDSARVSEKQMNDLRILRDEMKLLGLDISYLLPAGSAEGVGYSARMASPLPAGPDPRVVAEEKERARIELLSKRKRIIAEAEERVKQATQRLNEAWDQLMRERPNVSPETARRVEEARAEKRQAELDKTESRYSVIKGSGERERREAELRKELFGKISARISRLLGDEIERLRIIRDLRAAQHERILALEKQRPAFAPPGLREQLFGRSERLDRAELSRSKNVVTEARIRRLRAQQKLADLFARFVAGGPVPDDNPAVLRLARELGYPPDVGADIVRSVSGEPAFWKAVLETPQVELERAILGEVDAMIVLAAGLDRPDPTRPWLTGQIPYLERSLERMRKSAASFPSGEGPVTAAQLEAAEYRLTAARLQLERLRIVREWYRQMIELGLAVTPPAVPSSRSELGGLALPPVLPTAGAAAGSGLDAIQRFVPTLTRGLENPLSAEEADRRGKRLMELQIRSYEVEIERLRALIAVTEQTAGRVEALYRLPEHGRAVSEEDYLDVAVDGRRINEARRARIARLEAEIRALRAGPEAREAAMKKALAGAIRWEMPPVIPVPESDLGPERIFKPVGEAVRKAEEAARRERDAAILAEIRSARARLEGRIADLERILSRAEQANRQVPKAVPSWEIRRREAEIAGLRNRLAQMELQERRELWFAGRGIPLAAPDPMPNSVPTLELLGRMAAGEARDLNPPTGGSVLLDGKEVPLVGGTFREWLGQPRHREGPLWTIGGYTQIRKGEPFAGNFVPRDRLILAEADRSRTAAPRGEESVAPVHLYVQGVTPALELPGGIRTFVRPGLIRPSRKPLQYIPRVLPLEWKRDRPEDRRRVVRFERVVVFPVHEVRLVPDNRRGGWTEEKRLVGVLPKRISEKEDEALWDAWSEYMSAGVLDPNPEDYFPPIPPEGDGTLGRVTRVGEPLKDPATGETLIFPDLIRESGVLSDSGLWVSYRVSEGRNRYTGKPEIRFLVEGVWPRPKEAADAAQENLLPRAAEPAPAEAAALERLARKWGLADAGTTRLAVVSYEAVRAHSALRALAGRPLRMGRTWLLVLPEMDRSEPLLVNISGFKDWIFPLVSVPEVSVRGYGSEKEDRMLAAFLEMARFAHLPVLETRPVLSPDLKLLLKRIVANLAGLKEEAVSVEDLLELQKILESFV